MTDPEVPKRGKRSKYARVIKGVEIDVYDVLNAYKVTCPATAHAIKKLLMPGQRGAKDTTADLSEAMFAVGRAIDLERDNKANADG